MTVEITHPLIDGSGSGWAAAEMHDDVVALSSSMADFLHRSAVARTTPVIVTTAFSRLTAALAEALTGVRGRWLVRTGSDGFYDGFTGQVAASVDDALSLPPLQVGDGLADAFLARPIATRMRLITSIATRHRVSRPVRLGGALESLSLAVQDAPPAAWGAAEPAVSPWDRDQLTAFTRRRMPGESFWTAVGDAASPIVATVRVARTREGVEETSRMTADLGAPGDPRHADLGGIAGRALVAASSHGMPLIGFALAHVSTPDLTRPAHAEPSPQPLALMIGPAGVRMLEVPARTWVEEFDAETIGSPRLPGVLFPLAGDGGWGRVQTILRRPDPQVARQAVGVSPALEAALRQLSATRAATDA